MFLCFVAGVIFYFIKFVSYARSDVTRERNSFLKNIRLKRSIIVLKMSCFFLLGRENAARILLMSKLLKSCFRGVLLLSVVMAASSCIKVQQKSNAGGGGTSATTESSVAAVACTSTTSETPNTISGLKWWLDPDCITGLADNTDISTWTATVGANGTQTVAANKPHYRSALATMGSNPSVEFLATHHFDVTPAVVAQPYTLFVVARWPGSINDNTGATVDFLALAPWF